MTKKAAIEKAVRGLDALSSEDPESAHSRADDIVLELLCRLEAGTVTNAYTKLVGRCRWWGTA